MSTLPQFSIRYRCRTWGKGGMEKRNQNMEMEITVSKLESKLKNLNILNLGRAIYLPPTGR